MMTLCRSVVIANEPLSVQHAVRVVSDLCYLLWQWNWKQVTFCHVSHTHTHTSNAVYERLAVAESINQNFNDTQICNSIVWALADIFDKLPTEYCWIFHARVYKSMGAVIAPFTHRLHTYVCVCVCFPISIYFAPGTLFVRWFWVNTFIFSLSKCLTCAARECFPKAGTFMCDIYWIILSADKFEFDDDKDVQPFNSNTHIWRTEGARPRTASTTTHTRWPNSSSVIPDFYELQFFFF